MSAHQNTVVMEEVNDPEEIARALVRRERFNRNWEWLQAHSHEVYTRCRGMCIAIAGEELFVAATPEDAMAQAKAAHPKDEGTFIHYIPREKATRIYGNRW